MRINRIETDESLRSLLSYGSPEFPFAYYDDDLLQYEGRTVAWHWHPAVECSIVTEGTVHCKIFKNHYILNKNDILFMNGGAVHSFFSSRGGKIKSVIFSPEFLAPEDGSIYQAYVEPVLSSSLTHFVMYSKKARAKGIAGCLLECCRDAEQSKDPMQMLKIQGDINLLWQKIYPELIRVSDDIKSADAGELPKTTQRRGHLMLDYLHAHYGERILLDDIAQAANVSRREALRCFSACFDTTPIAYLNDYRIEKAKTILSQTEMSITETAFKCGFDNPGYFCKVFRKKAGITPLTFRGGHV